MGIATPGGLRQRIIVYRSVGAEGDAGAKHTSSRSSRITSADGPDGAASLRAAKRCQCGVLRREQQCAKKAPIRTEVSRGRKSSCVTAGEEISSRAARITVLDPPCGGRSL